MATGAARRMPDLGIFINWIFINRTEDADKDEISMNLIVKLFEVLWRGIISLFSPLTFIRYKNPEQTTFHRKEVDLGTALSLLANSVSSCGWILTSIRAAIAPTATTSSSIIKWVLDSGASFSVTGDLSVLRGLHCAELVCVAAANGQLMWSELCGRATGNINISGVRYIDGAKMNLISSGFLVRLGCKINHTVQGVQICKGDVIVGFGRLLPNNLWQLDFLDESRLDGPACTICQRLDAQPPLLDGCAADHVSTSDDADFSRAEHDINEGRAKTSAAWVVATAAPHHATGNRDLLSGFIMEHDDLFVHASDGVPRKVLARGAVITDAVILPDVWFVPGLTENLVSVSQLAELDYSVAFSCGECCIRSTDGMVVGKGHRQEGGLYLLDFLKIPLAI